MPYEKIGKNDPVCIADEVPFEIPDSWEWVRLGSIGETNIGLTYRPSDKTDSSGTLVLRSSNIQDGKMDYSDCVYVSCAVPERAMISKGDILICARNGSRSLVGKCAIVDNNGMAFGAFMAKFSSMFNPYIKVFIDSPAFRGQLEGVKTETINQITQEMLRNQLIPLPPLNEQKRIVEALSAVQIYIDKYDKKETELSALNSVFPDMLKKSILQQAVMGKLVPQDPNDEPASVLLERIRAEKQELIKAGKLKKDKYESIIYRRDNSHYEKLDGGERCIDDEIPFEIPDNWEWVRLGNIINLQSGQDLTPDKYNDKCKGIPYITGASNIEDATVLINRWTEYGRAFAYRGDLLLTCKGTVGTMAFLNENQVHIARQIMSIHPYDDIDAKYVRIVLETLVEGLKAAAKSMIPGISREDVLTALFPLPPLNEQRRIAEMIDIVSDPIGNL